ncbi:MAG: response regulator [bacterium]
METKKVLIIDDDKVLSDMLVQEFSKYQINTITARNATEGLDMITNQKPDLVIADIMMPGESGLDLIAAVRKIPEIKNTFFVVLTNSSKTYDVAKAMTNKVTIFLQKSSVDPSTVVDMVKGYLK